MINNNGAHPFLDKNDSLNDLKIKLRNPKFKNICSECNENKHNYQLCDLIKKMTKLEAEERYSIE